MGATAEQQQELVLSDNPAASRYEVHIGGVLAGICEYRRSGNALVMPHTVVQPEFEGRGIGNKLVHYAVDDARNQGLTIVPTCWFVAKFIEEHPEYANLVSS